MLNQLSKYVLYLCVLFVSCVKDSTIEKPETNKNYTGTYTGVMKLHDEIWRYSDTPPFYLIIDSSYQTTLAINHNTKSKQCTINNYYKVEWSDSFFDFRYHYQSKGGYTSIKLAFKNVDSAYYIESRNVGGSYYFQEFKGIKN